VQHAQSAHLASYGKLPGAAQLNGQPALATPAEVRKAKGSIGHASVNQPRRGKGQCAIGRTRRRCSTSISPKLGGVASAQGVCRSSKSTACTAWPHGVYVRCGGQQGRVQDAKLPWVAACPHKVHTRRLAAGLNVDISIEEGAGAGRRQRGSQKAAARLAGGWADRQAGWHAGRQQQLARRGTLELQCNPGESKGARGGYKVVSHRRSRRFEPTD